ncbi:N(4)-(beta-N-acetylglucosaminyl)-L-asparaginase [Pseudemcibacter aquimaris]|uniref:N(4)-(beta-N-acetylglucosaminyl)-L-asparaginase n=1 Tax=Pseudemcibacter aquimaris TaxID=2857064 RepID=UPI002011F408|nr:N(4)-(beta-N-acetylglucosaminyl)-L-asparaginase [Pseudemcibacter aquimaris]MCC3859674.1 N(4)-(beta-N-acetylglucosaminyl)-L-asparaginase [Pseudemcibacter aquimaris]WDU60069.1 N(4)-(beta-N-acetylglucosaminyl)-L-asparaginase [Pseudemcibacter aquimaris]
MSEMNRRELLGAAATVAAVGTVASAAKAQAPAVMSSYKPLVVGAHNGHRLKNENGETGVEIAFRMMGEGADVLDATIHCNNLPEISEEDTSVGYGGLPDANGDVTLDACCMHGPLKRAGGVAYIQGVRTPSWVAKDVMMKTNHHLLAGQGALDFAREHGHKIEGDLNSERSFKRYLEWKKRVEEEGDTRTFAELDLDFIEKKGFDVAYQMAEEGRIDIEHIHGTINTNAMNHKGEICGNTTTSGRSFKVPGRVGDSPILGAGLYVDNEVGAAGSTGLGEMNLYHLCSFLIVEKMREGMHPKDAGMYALNRIKDFCMGNERYMNDKGEIRFNLQFYVLDKKGRYAGVAMRGGEGRFFAVCDENGGRHELMDSIYMND